jgi:uncharacterized protein YdaU (DUF1376 family)
MNDELPFFSIPVRDVLAEIADLDDAERGAYLSLVLGSWAEGGPLSADPQRLARRAGTDRARWESTWSVIGRFFQVDGDRISHPLVDREMARAREQKEVRQRIAAPALQRDVALTRAQRDELPDPSGAVFR